MSIPITPIGDYIKEDGSTDWVSYRKAQINNGERCKKCKSFITFHKGYPNDCYNCKKLIKEEELLHNTVRRFPYCKQTWDPLYDTNYDIYSDGIHNIICDECNKEFLITTYVSYTFVSPKIENNKNKPASQEGDS